MSVSGVSPFMRTNVHEGVLQVRKKVWKQMSDAIYIDQAVSWSKDLTRMRARGPGDTENAMRSIGRDTGIDYWFLWRLRYRRNQIKELSISVYMGLKAAYEAECERQMRKLANDIEKTKAIVGPDHPVVVAAQTALDAFDE